MAVQFLNNIDLNNNQLQEFKVDNQTSDPTGLAGVGQLIYRTDNNTLKYHTGSNNWVTLGTGTGSGTVTSVATTHAGNAFTASIGNVSTVNPSVDITMPGNANEYINGAGNRVLLSTIPQGDITGISPTDGLTGTLLTGPVPVIKVEYTGTDNIVLKASDLNGAGTPVVADSIMFSDATDNDVRTATISQIVALAPQGDITAVVAGTGMTGGGTSGSVTLNVIGSSGILANADNIAIDYTATGIINDANSGTSITLLDADEFLFEDVSATASVAVKRGTLSQLKTYIGNTGVTSINFKTDGTALNVNSNTVTGSGTMTGIWQGSSAQYVRGDGDLATFPSIPTVGDGQINGATSGDGISGSMSATANQSGNTTFTVTSNATTASTPSTLMYRDSSGFGYVDTPSSGDSTEKIATTAFVQASLTGLLQFKGGFNASTGAIVGGGNLTSGGSRVAVEVGDYYVVTVAGNFFGNAATPLTPGDSVIVQTAKAAGTSVEADFIVVQSDTDLATNSTVGLMFINPTGTGITSNISSGAATLTNTDKGSSQNIFKTITATSGTTTANTNSDTLTVVGAGGASTAISGDTLTITSANDDTGITGVTLAQGTSTGATNVLEESISGRTLTLTSNKYAGGSNAGYVPIGGGATTFLRGDGTWVTPTNTNLVTSVDEIAPGTSTGTPIIVNPTTGAVKVKSMAYDGGTDVGHVPTGGGATTFLRGDGTWVVPTNTQGVTTVTASTVGNLDGLSATPTSGAVVVGLDITGMTETTGNAEGADKFPIYDDSASANRYIDADALAGLMRSLNTFTGNIANGQSTGKFVHGLGINVMVQCYESSTGDTVYADIQRNPDGDNVNEIQATVGTAVATGSILVMVTRIQQLSV